MNRELEPVLSHVQEETARLTAEVLDDAGEGRAAVEEILQAGGLTLDQVFGPWLPDDLAH